MANNSAKNREWPEWYRVIQGRDILFPENEYKFKLVPEGLWKHIQKKAAELLKQRPYSPAFEREHWQKIVDGQVPYGLQIERKTHGKKETVHEED